MVDSIADYELLALQFDKSETPKFNDNAKKMKIEVTGLPKREEAEAGINEQLIVEYYSR